MELWINHLIRDVHGKITEDKEYEGKSFLGRFLECINVQLMYIRSDISKTDGIMATVSPHTDNMRLNAGTGASTWGIQVGTGTAAVAHSDVALQTLITHGTGAGQLQYSATTFGATVATATTSEFTITRNFANGSGADITVFEIGAVYLMRSTHHLIARDVISAGILIPNGQTLTVNYKFRATI